MKNTIQVLIVLVGVLVAVSGISLMPIIEPNPDGREKSPDACFQPMIIGPCTERIQRYYYNSASSRCERFYFGGCYGSENNFDDLRSCQLACMAKEIGVLPSPPEDDFFKLFP